MWEDGCRRPKYAFLSFLGNRTIKEVNMVLTGVIDENDFVAANSDYLLLAVWWWWICTFRSKEYSILCSTISRLTGMLSTLSTSVKKPKRQKSNKCSKSCVYVCTTCRLVTKIFDISTVFHVSRLFRRWFY